jgi:hypothetical protein
MWQPEQVSGLNCGDGTDSQADSAGFYSRHPLSPRRPRPGHEARTWALIVSGLFSIFRAISGPLARWNEHARHAVVVLALVALGLDVAVDSFCNGLIRAACLVLVDHRRASGVVADPCYEVLEPRAARGGEVVPGVAQIVKVQAGTPIDSTACGQADSLLKLPRRSARPLRPGRPIRITFLCCGRRSLQPCCPPRYPTRRWHCPSGHCPRSRHGHPRQSILPNIRCG